MVRLTLIEIASFLLPFLIFLIWRWQSEHDALKYPTPVLKLGALGAGTAVLLFLVLALFEGVGNDHIGERYVPPQVVDGEIVPGHFIANEADETTDDPVTDDPATDDPATDSPDDGDDETP
jgi:hypothetical protein